MSHQDVEDKKSSETLRLPSKDDHPVPHAFPEGGRQAWMSVLGVWIVQYATFGHTNAFGVFNDYYVRTFETKYSSFQLSWIGSVQLMLVLSAGLLTGRAFDEGYFYHIVILSSLLFVFCQFMLSLVQQDQYYQVFLVQALGIGLGVGGVYVPSMALVSHYFQRHRALVMGIAATGSGVGGAVQAVILNKLFHGRLGFRNGVRVNTAINAILLAFAISIMRTRPHPTSPGAHNKGSTLKYLSVFLRDPPYVFTVCGTMLVLAGLYFPIFFLQLNAIQNGVDPNLAFYVITVLNGASVIGRFVSTILVRPLGVFNSVVPCVFACAILIFCTLAIRNIAVTMVFAVLYGLFSGAYIGLLVPMLVSLAKVNTEIGARMGICFTFTGFGGLIGSPIAGALLTTSFIWWRPIVFAGVCVTSGGISFMICRLLLAQRKGTQVV